MQFSVNLNPNLDTLRASGGAYPELSCVMLLTIQLSMIRQSVYMQTTARTWLRAFRRVSTELTCMHACQRA